MELATAYRHREGTHNAALTEVGRGTPMGELLRRYWLPIGRAEDATDLPKQIRALGEDLVLFRDKKGRPGLVHPRCVHRGSSLFYGRVEEEGIRCCYHGWMFDTEGRCVDQPCEPERGRHKEGIRQPWYPLEERYGLIWVFMGPPERQPLLPRYNVFEDLAEDERLFTDDNNIGGGTRGKTPIDCNWLQHFENIHDAGHFLWLHYFHSGPQFGPRFGEFDSLDFEPWKWLQAVDWTVTDRGVSGTRSDVLPDGRKLLNIVETVLPMIRVVPNPFGQPGPVDQLGFMLPVDDTHFRIYTVLRGKDDGYFRKLNKFRDDWYERVDADPTYSQRFPSDYEAQASQGPITLHSEEHLGQSDKRIVMLRRLFKEQLDALAEGRDLMGVVFEPGEELVVLESGTFIS